MRTEHQTKQFGFTLMELLAVMAIMAVLTTFAVTSYFAAINGMAKRSAVKHVVNTLVLARQRACMEGVRVSVVFFNEMKGYEKDSDGELLTSSGHEILSPTYVICRAVGHLSYVDSSGVIGDEFADLDKMFGTEDLGESYAGRMRIYNLTLGGWWDVKPWVDRQKIRESSDVGEAGSYVFPYSEGILGETEVPGAIMGYKFLFKTSDAKNTSGTCVGDAYGIEAAPANTLPKGFVFRNLESYSDLPICIHFKPDGSLDTSHNGASSITILQKRGTAQSSNTISLNAQTGEISYSDTWTN